MGATLMGSHMLESCGMRRPLDGKLLACKNTNKSCPWQIPKLETLDVFQPKKELLPLRRLKTNKKMRAVSSRVHQFVILTECKGNEDRSWATTKGAVVAVGTRFFFLVHENLRVPSIFLILPEKVCVVRAPCTYYADTPPLPHTHIHTHKHFPVPGTAPRLIRLVLGTTSLMLMPLTPNRTPWQQGS